VQGPLTWVHPDNPFEGKLTGSLMPFESSTEAAIWAPDFMAKSMNLCVAFCLQAAVLPCAALLHCQWTFQKNVETSKASTCTIWFVFDLDACPKTDPRNESLWRDANRSLLAPVALAAETGELPKAA